MVRQFVRLRSFFLIRHSLLMLFLILLTRRVLMTGWRQLTACQQLFTHILLSCQSFDLVGLFTASLGSHLGKVTQPLGQLCLWQCNAFFLKFFCNPVRGERRDRPERCTVDNEFLGCHNQTQCVSGCFIVTSSGVLTIFHID